MKLNILVLTLVVIFYFSCEFEPTGTNFRQIDKTFPEKVINLNSTGDTILAAGSMQFGYSINLQGRTLYGIDFLLDSVVFHSSFDTAGTFNFNSIWYSSGSHRMRLAVRSSPGTGSIGEHYGLEELNIFREWTVLIDNEPPDPVAILQIIPYQGRLRIEWEKYTRWNFGQYGVYKIRSEDFSNQLYQIGTVMNADSTYWIDSSYIGGESTYWVDVQAYGGIARNEPVSYVSSTPQFLDFRVDENNHLVFTWSRCQFENNMNEYELGSYLLDHRTSDAYDTVYVDSTAAFGTSIQYELSVNSRQLLNHPYSIFSDTISAFLGVRFFEFQWMSYVADLNSYFLQGWDYIRRIDWNTFEVNAIIPRYSEDMWTMYEFGVSANGLYAYAVAVNVNENTQIIKVNPNTLGFEESYLLKDILPFSFKAELGSTIQLSNQNTLAFQCYHSVGYPYTQNDGIVLIDMTTHTFLDLLPGVLTFQLSANGNYLISEDSVYAIIDGKFNPVGAIDGTRSAFLNEGDQIVSTADYMISSLNSADLSTISSHTIDFDLHQPCADALNNTIGAYYFISDYNQFYKVFNLNSGQQIYSVPTLPVGPVYLFNNTIINAFGYYLQFPLP